MLNYFAPASVRSCSISENLKCLAAASAVEPSFMTCCHHPLLLKS